MSHPRMKVGVVGTGRMGRFHAKVMAKVAHLAGIVDPDAARAQAVAAEFGTSACASSAALLATHPDLKAVVIAVPTVHHAAAAAPFLERGVAVLVEKPLAASAAEAAELAAAAQRSGSVLQVGHVERFNPATQALLALVRELGLKPRYIQAVRQGPCSFRSLDISVVSDLGVHDLDLLLALTGAPIAEMDAVGASVVSGKPDLCSAWLRFEGGCRAHLSVSRVATAPRRTLAVFCDEAALALDLGAKTGVQFRLADHAGDLALVQARLAAGEDLSSFKFADHLKPLPLDTARFEQDALTAQAQAFLAAVRGERKPEVDGAAAVAAVRAVERLEGLLASH